MRKSLLILVLWAATTAHAQDSNGPSQLGFLDTTKLVYDYLADGALSPDDPAARQFRTLPGAYAAAPEGGDHGSCVDSKPWVTAAASV